MDTSEAGTVVWLTGLPASGKSTIATILATALRRADTRTVVLDSDDLRTLLTPRPTYEPAERDQFYASIAGLAERLAASGVTVLIAATASKRAYRDAARARVERFVEVWLRCDDQLLEARDPKGLYAKSRAGKLRTLPGRGAPYEPPLNPELTFDTGEASAEAIAAEIESYLRRPEADGLDEHDVQPKHVERYLRRHVHPRAQLVGLTPLGRETQEGLKSHGYGKPLRVTFDEDGRQRDLTLRTMGADEFGHDRRADHFEGLVLANDQFGWYPRHVVPVDVGVITPTGVLRSVGDGEPFLLTNYVDGELYAHDLSRLAPLAAAPPADVDRARALASYLATLHREVGSAAARRRHVRDLIGHGEGVFGLVDAFPADDLVATPQRLRAIEHAVVDWRWTSRHRDDRARRTHGDFHPFNLLFRDGTDFTVLDASRGGVGDPADDVTCLSINYAFFALANTGRFDGALRELWTHFWAQYLEEADDPEVLDMVAPYFAWRSLVLACPSWYPNLSAEVRERILRFAERLLEGARFTPDGVDVLFG